MAEEGISQGGAGRGENLVGLIEEGVVDLIVEGQLGVEGPEGELDVENEVGSVGVMVIGLDEGGVLGPDFDKDLVGGGDGDHWASGFGV